MADADFWAQVPVKATAVSCVSGVLLVQFISVICPSIPVRCGKGLLAV